MKCELHEHISRLLFDHECVIVPGFGAFLSRYYSAEVNPATHMLRPPSRRLYFNKSIKQNDGLLAKSISLTEQISYNSALNLIEKSVRHWIEGLSKGQKIKLPGIGRLYLDDHSTLQFSPSLENNYQRSSYGLAIFRSPAIHREEAIRKSIQKGIERHIASDPAKPVQKKRIAWAAVLGPVIFAGIVGAAYYGYQTKSFGNLSGFNWLEWNSSAEEETPANEDLNRTPSPEVKKELVKEEKPAVPEEIAADVEEVPVSRIYPYHVVVGSFKDEANAQIYLDQLSAKGYEAYLANGDSRFYRVAVGNFASIDQARNALQGVRLNLNSQAWIYRN